MVHSVSRKWLILENQPIMADYRDPAALLRDDDSAKILLPATASQGPTH
jgi:hypothetical protein